jgi:ribulose-phosphate 3-epimerase
MQIIPTIGLKKQYSEAEEAIRQLRNYSSWIQIDVCDSVFAPGKTFELELLNRLDFETKNNLWDVHLMVKEPINWVNKCIEVGASRIIGQVEIMSDREKFLEKVKSEAAEAGLSYDINTEIDAIEGDWDIIQVMGRQAGFGYFEFEKKVLDKIKKIKDMGYMVGVDGGADVDNIEMIEKAGADIVYSEVNYWDLLEYGKNKKTN